MNVSAIVAAFGAYYIASAERREILQKIYQPSETDAALTLVPTTDSVLRRGKIRTTSVLQAFQKQFTPQGAATLGGRQIDLHPLKIDVVEYPDDLMDTWVQFLAGMDSAKRTEWPFIRWWIENEIIPKSIEDWEIDGVFKAVKGSVTPGTPLPAAQALNGLRHCINQEIQDTGDITPFEIGPIETDPIAFVEQVEAFVSMIPQLTKRFITQLNMSHTLAERFATGSDKIYNTNYASQDWSMVRRSRIKVNGLASMEGSDKMWCTLQGNAVVGYRRSRLATTFEVEGVDRQVKIYTDFDKGVGIWEPQYFYTNNDDLDD